ncbi:radical SAM protein [Candidatus Eisenbacteria bacterium]|uniref:Radical SAM protein n=1 Tax=Eiseniibacteriota bacterium TaxID=2212470 RepID=A0ABV6YJQ7_UNCEI
MLGGGEPFLQADFLLACLRACRQRGLHTAVDTSGYVEPELIREACAVTDLFLYDLKTLDDARHRRHVGVPVGPILENLQVLKEAAATVWIRLPLIPGVNDDEASIEAIGRFLVSLDLTQRVHLLPFHKAGMHKNQRLNAAAESDDLESMSPEAVTQIAEQLAAFGLDVHKGG